MMGAGRPDRGDEVRHPQRELHLQAAGKSFPDALPRPRLWSRTNASWICAQFKSVTAEDVAKRLMDYGFHAPTLSWPVAGTLMVEPTESESQVRTRPFLRRDDCHPRGNDRHGIRRGGREEQSAQERAAHGGHDCADNWNRPYPREQAAFPVPGLRDYKFWPAVGRVDNVYRRPQSRLLLRGDGELSELTDFTAMNLFSRLQGGGKKLDKLIYELPEGLRYQIVQLWEKGFGPDERWHPGPGLAYGKIHQILCEEHQMLQLPQVSRQSLPLRGIIAEYFLNLEDTAKALDVVQVVFSIMDQMLHRPIEMWGSLDDPFSLSRYRAPEIIEELNRRFRENNVGYQYVQGLIKKTSQGLEPLPLKERLVAGEPARNLRKIKDLIEGATVTAIHDPYTTTGSLETILKLADMGTQFSHSLRILGTEKPLSNSTEKKSFLGLLKDINTERKASWEVRVYSTGMKPHRRFLILNDGSTVTCGMSLNHIDKDEVLDHEPSGSENAIHDHQLFEDKWKIATPI